VADGDRLLMLGRTSPTKEATKAGERPFSVMLHRYWPGGNGGRGTTMDQLYERPTWLRLSRAGGDVVAEASGDGKAWVRVDRGAKDFLLPRKLKVGVFAEAIGDHDFKPVFDEFKLTRK